MQMGVMYGYARVSARDQNLRRQLDALAEYGIESERIYADKASGKNFERPEWNRLMLSLREGDLLVVKSIDRLGRNYTEILEQWRLVTKEHGASIAVIDMPLLDTRARRHELTDVLIADIVLSLLSYVAQVERENIRQRQAEGIAAAKARGVRFGRPRKVRPDNYRVTRDLFLNGKLTRRDAARQLHVSTSTFGRWLKEDQAVRKP